MRCAEYHAHPPSPALSSLAGTANVVAITAHIKKNHEYDVPEVISAPLSALGNVDYLKWVWKNTRQGAAAKPDAAGAAPTTDADK